MVIMQNKDGSPIWCVDYQALKKFCMRETQHMMSPFHLAMLFPTKAKKMASDACNRYHLVAIHEDNRHFMTFITPWG
jgi:hypothetical protein